MSTSPTLSTPSPPSRIVKPPKICPLLPLPPTTTPIPTLALPPSCSDVELPPRYFNTAETLISSTSPFTTPTHSAVFALSAISSSLQSPQDSVIDASHCAHMIDHAKNGISIGSFDRKLSCRPKNSRVRMSPPSSYHSLRPPSHTRNIPVLVSPSSAFETNCLPCNSNISQVQDSSS